MPNPDTRFLKCSRDHELPSWPFPVPKNTTVFTVNQVLEEGCPVVFFANTPNGWEALPDGGPFDPLEDGTVVCLACLCERNPSLFELADLPVGWTAERVVGGPWRRQHEPDYGTGE